MSAGARHMILLFFLNFALEFVGSYKCDRTPEGHIAPKTPADNRFRLKISGNPDKYVPGEGYTGNIFMLIYNRYILHVCNPEPYHDTNTDPGIYRIMKGNVV